MKKWASTAMVAGVLVATAGLGYGISQATAPTSSDRNVSASPTPQLPGDSSSSSPSAKTSAKPSATPSASATPSPSTSPEASPSAEPTPSPKPEVKAGPRLLGPGDKSKDVRVAQARLRQIAWFAGEVSDNYGTKTTQAVKGFQAKRGLPVTGEIDQRTLDRLNAMTRQPTADELANKLATSGGNTPGKLDPRCTTGRALCIDKRSRTLSFVVDGQVRSKVDVRFGSQYTPTREGLFKVDFKSRNHVSSLYKTKMPFAMFFSGGQAVHFSSDFAARGYSGASHGCVNVRDWNAIAAMFDQVNVGDKVVVYWS